MSLSTENKRKISKLKGTNVIICNNPHIQSYYPETFGPTGKQWKPRMPTKKEQKDALDCDLKLVYLKSSYRYTTDLYNFLKDVDGRKVSDSPSPDMAPMPLPSSIHPVVWLKIRSQDSVIGYDILEKMKNVVEAEWGDVEVLCINASERKHLRGEEGVRNRMISGKECNGIEADVLIVSDVGRSRPKLHLECMSRGRRQLIIVSPEKDQLSRKANLTGQNLLMEVPVLIRDLNDGSWLAKIIKS